MGSSVQVSVSYGSDIERVEGILLEVAQRGGIRRFPGWWGARAECPIRSGVWGVRVLGLR